jgi:hypothetical protein
MSRQEVTGGSFQKKTNIPVVMPISDILSVIMDIFSRNVFSEIVKIVACLCGENVFKTAPGEI